MAKKKVMKTVSVQSLVRYHTTIYHHRQVHKNQYIYVLVDDDKSWYDNAQGIEHLTTNPNKQCGIKKMMFKDYFSSLEE